MNGSIISNITAVLYLAVFMAAGQLLSRRAFGYGERIARITLGVTAGLVMLMWLPALFALVLGFGLAAQLLALAAAVCIGAYCIKTAKKPLAEEEDIPLKPYLCCVLPVFLLLVRLAVSHTLPETEGGGLCSGQSTYGDMCMHLGIISSITRQGFFPPEYSILPGQAMSYPFLCDSVSSTFYTLGASLRLSYILPMLPAFFAVASGVYILFEDWFKRSDKAVIAFLLFFIGGGFGFAYFMDGLRSDPFNFTRIFTEFYETPTNLIGKNIRWVNVIADMLIPQRATLFGWSVLFPCLYMLRKAVFDGKESFFIPLGIIGGCLPLIHTHSFLALGLVSLSWLLLSVYKGKSIKRFLLYGIIAVVLAAPQLLFFTFRQAGGFLALNPNWANDTDTFLWFYVKNLGLIFILLPVAFIAARKEDREVWLGVLPLWVLAELIQFQPNPYDNNKLLFIWFAFSCGLVASLLSELYSRLSGMKGRWLLAGIMIVSLTLSGALTLGREAVSRYELFSAGELEAAGYIDTELPTDCVILTGVHHNNAVAALTGRNIVCGSSAYLYYHGFDTYDREQDVAAMYESPGSSAALFEKYNVSYIYIGVNERYTYDIDYDFFSALDPVFSGSAATVYRYK